MKTLFIAVTAVILSCNAYSDGSSSKVGMNAHSDNINEGYSIPDNLTPLKKWSKGYTAEETLLYRRTYTGTTLVEAGDGGAYAGLHISEVLPTAIIHRDGPVSLLESNTNPKIERVTATTDLGSLTLREMIQDPRSRMQAIAVIHKGKLVFEEYPAMRPWDNHVWASAAKSLNGILLHQLEEEGLLDLTKTVGEYLPELVKTPWAKVPVSEVLHQRSGIDVREGSLGNPGHPTTMFYATLAGGDDLPDNASFLDSVLAAGKLREPGELYEYSSINTFVLGMILERLTSKPFEDLVTERIWSKAGMEGDALLGLSPTGEPSAFGIFSSRLRDLGRYGMLYTPSWNVVASKPVVSNSYFPKVYAASKPEIYAGNNLGDRMIAGFGNVGMGASYQWDAVFPDGDVYKSGRTGQALYVSGSSPVSVGAVLDPALLGKII